VRITDGTGRGVQATTKPRIYEEDRHELGEIRFIFVEAELRIRLFGCDEPSWAPFRASRPRAETAFVSAAVSQSPRGTSAQAASAVSGRAIVVACVLYGFSLILIDIAPFFIGLYVDHLGLTLSQAGLVQSVDQAGGVLGAISGFFLMPRARWRTIIVAASLVATLGNVLTAFADGYLVLCVIRFVAGFGVVLITTVTACVLAQAAVPVRAYGAGLALGMTLSAVAIWLLEALRAQFGDAAALGSGALWLGLGAVLALLLPLDLDGPSEPALPEDVPQMKGGARNAGRLALLGLLLFGVSVNVIYAFIERIGLTNGLDQGSVANAMAFGYIFSGLGSLIPTIFGESGRHLRWIGITTVVFLSSILGIYLAHSTAFFTVAFAIYASAWCMGLAFYMSMTAENDPSHRYTRMIYVVNVAAQSVGPAIGTLVLARASLTAVFIVTPLPALLAALLVSSTRQARVASPPPHPAH
jgi:predicted MFS family arabinose efflux permease